MPYLRHQRNILVIPFRIEFSDISAINEHASTVRIIKSLDQSKDSGFTTA